MSKIFLEYIWLDGSDNPNFRSKTKVYGDKGETTYPEWSFDGSSTGQATEGEDTDCILKPVFDVKDPFRGNPHRLVLCEVFNADGTPHETNKRHKLRETLESLGVTDEINEEEIEKWTSLGFGHGRGNPEGTWFGWEQEYTMMTKPLNPFGVNEGVPLGFTQGEPREQGDYYCGVGSDNVIGRSIAEEHLEKCLESHLEVSGINAEVMLGQWEYQIGPVSPLYGSDQLIMSRYILRRIAEERGVKISFHPKPLTGSWNGSGCHVNFSTKEMREEGGLEKIYKAMERLESKHEEHISEYGMDNDQRMTGEYETSDLNEFSFGVSTRNTSIRIPLETTKVGKGYFEDRRPASNCDPYRVSKIMLETILEEELVNN
jgi:glutamine synthetase